MAAEEPKLIIDTDWKSQAQAEKERLAQKTAAAKPATPPGAAAGAPGPEGAPEAQEVRFEDVVGLLATQALSYLGYFGDPQTGQAVVSLEYAKLHIDMLAVLEAKTKGNLTEQEQKFLAKTLSQLRMEFVEISKAVAKAVQEGRIKPTAGGGIVGPGMGGASGAAGPKGPGGTPI
jgi:DNA replication initiation complex subunit (GINS family)